MLIPINNTNSFLTNSIQRIMGRTIFIREIIIIENEPRLCPTCEKEDRLERDIIREERSDGKTILCARCEALIIVTNHNLKQVELSSQKDDTIMLKEPHLIRKVTY
jgi:hypothetical protein